MGTDTTQAAIALALEWSLMHETKAANEPEGSDARKYHREAMKALDKAIEQMTLGNTPTYAPGTDGVYTVRSRTTAGNVYRMNVYSNTCNGEKCFNKCWHLSAAQVVAEVVARAAKAKREAADRLARFTAEHGDMQIADDVVDIPVASFPEQDESTPKRVDMSGDEAMAAFAAGFGIPVPDGLGVPDDDAFRLDKDIVDLDDEPLYTRADEERDLANADYFDAQARADEDDITNPRYDPIPTESLWDQAQRYQ
jgi:hypothetical protein